MSLAIRLKINIILTMTLFKPESLIFSTLRRKKTSNGYTSIIKKWR